MKTLDEIYQIVEESSHETAFNKEEVAGLIATLLKLPEKANIVEIGVEYGRSTTVIAEMAKDHPEWNFIAIDNFGQDNGEEAKQHVIDQVEKYGWSFTLLVQDSLEASQVYEGEIDMIHIDGDHSYEGVKVDVEAWLDKVKVGGYACFDDYGHPGLDGVKQAVDEYMETHPEWNFLMIWGSKLGIFKKL